MSQIGLIITINRFTSYFESNTYTSVFENIDEARNKLVSILVENFKYLNIDFPNNLVDFEYQWFKQQYVKANAFTYKIFSNGIWTEPWDYDDVYDDVLVKLEEYEIQNVPDFAKMYGEPNPDVEADDNFNIENNENVHEFETKLKEIISQAQSVKIQEDEVRDCQCDKCQEGYKVQQMKKELEQEFMSSIKQSTSSLNEINL